MNRRHYIVTYDVGDDKRRNKIFELLTGLGDHVQFSVFLCQLSNTERAKLIGQLKQIVNNHHDQVIIMDLGPATRPLELGQALHCVGKPYQPPTRVLVV